MWSTLGGDGSEFRIEVHEGTSVAYDGSTGGTLQDQWRRYLLLSGFYRTILGPCRR